jgi:hypothetical protein
LRVLNESALALAATVAAVHRTSNTPLDDTVQTIIH